MNPVYVARTASSVRRRVWLRLWKLTYFERGYKLAESHEQEVQVEEELELLVED
jgi:hypothetical protein